MRNEYQRKLGSKWTRCTSPVSMVSQFKLVSGWQLRKSEISTAPWAIWLGKDFTPLSIQQAKLLRHWVLIVALAAHCGAPWWIHRTVPTCTCTCQLYLSASHHDVSTCKVSTADLLYSLSYRWIKKKAQLSLTNPRIAYETFARFT